MQNNHKLWEASASRKESSHMAAYMEFLRESKKLKFKNYQELHEWSVKNPQDFWPTLFEFPSFSPLYEGNIRPAFQEENFLNYTWFPGIKLNFAENLLKSVLHHDPASPVSFTSLTSKIALNFVHESGLSKKISYGKLLQQTQKLQQWLREVLGESGEKGAAGQVLAAYMPNIPETVISMLGIASLGGVFTSTSCDFGVQGVIDRFGQIGPAVLVAATGYTYNGKYFDQTEKIKEIQKQLPSLKKVILVDFLERHQGPAWEGTVFWKEIVGEEEERRGDLIAEISKKMSFVRVPFKTPLFIMYSSGTTGKPKCIIHSTGGTLLQHMKELGLHTDFRSSKNLFFFTTCGWMMWNWLVSGLFFGGTVTLYEGSPSFPSLPEFLNIINRENINIFGISPKFLRSLETLEEMDNDNENESLPKEYPTLETILSTGSPLLPEQFDYIYQKIKKDVLLSSICGGTDIIGCFMLGNPLLPVYRGEIQCLGLGMDVAAFNENEETVIGQEGELVCKKIFPSMPVGFWGDDSSKSLFRRAYFEEFPGVWHHGDFIRISEEGTVRVFGRSDATLNPGGVRIGTAEIYQQTEKLPYVMDGLCVGLQREGDVQVVLFVKMREGELLSEEKKKEIKTLIRQNTTPRHVPGEIYQVQDIPYTRSGKKMELLVAKVLNHKPISNLAAVANPECLKEFEKFLI